MDLIYSSLLVGYIIVSLQKLVDVLVLVICLHHPDTLLAKSSNYGEDWKFGVRHSCIKLLLDSYPRVNESESCSSSANAGSAVH